MWGWFKNRDEPEFVRAYRENTSRKIGRKTPVTDLEFVSLDAETTGLNITTDCLLSIAVVPIVAGKLDIESRHTWLVQQIASPNNDAVKSTESLPGSPPKEFLK